MGLHRSYPASVTCHLTQVSSSRLNPSQAGRYSIYVYPEGMEGWVDLGGQLYTEIVYVLWWCVSVWSVSRRWRAVHQSLMMMLPIGGLQDQLSNRSSTLAASAAGRQIIPSTRPAAIPDYPPTIPTSSAAPFANFQVITIYQLTII